ncbi:MAG: DNA/RNA non-specific endonuclease [Treponema sp.]|nr:DNA/RNA non-specific endonuclease [Treponema sp.]
MLSSMGDSIESSIESTITTAKTNIPKGNNSQPAGNKAPVYDETDKHLPVVTRNLPIGLEIPLCQGTKALAEGKQLPQGHEIHKYSGFTLCYREDYEQAEWVAYCLTKDELTKESERSNDFHEDKNISTKSATPGDYTRSGYDRGHLAPAGDMSFSTQAMQDSFNMSNMSPQVPAFNRGIWKNLEEQTRKWANKFGAIYVVSGPLLDKPASSYKTIGANKVVVPEYYYKALLAPMGDSVIAVAFLLPNAKVSDSYWNYALSIDELEKRTGLDFFYLLDDETERQIEKSYRESNWN